MSQEKRIPHHVAIIMDGNGRWAEQRGKERYVGHMQGVESVRRAVKGALKTGVEYLTLYAFSTENWGRPTEEVDALMEILCRSIIDETPELKRQGVRVRMIGAREAFSERVQQHLTLIEEETAQQEKLTLILALNYSSRMELTRAARLLAERVERGELKAAEINETSLSEALYTASWPDPDLVIRTSGECRLSNFLLWQSSYAELYFPQVLWPDFTEEEFERALEEYGRRDRRFGLVK